MKKNILKALLFLNCYMLQAQIGIGIPNPAPSAILELNSTTKGFLPPRLTSIQRDAIISPAIGLMIYNSTQNCLEWYDGTVWYNGCGNQESSGGTAVVSSYNCSTASDGTLSQGIAASGVTQTITATVSRVGAYNISAITNGVTFAKSGMFTTVGIQDIVLTATGTPLVEGSSNFVLNTMPNCNFSRMIQPPVINAICDGSAPTLVVPITSSTGRIWMDRNLGASRRAIAADDYQAYGCLYQWGRGNDGHASMTWKSSTSGMPVNGSTSIKSVTDNPGGNLFILTTSYPYDWRSTQNNTLWQGVTGINNPCPAGYRLPNGTEIAIEATAYNITNSQSAFNALHNFVIAGRRNINTAALDVVGSNGYYWSSTIKTDLVSNSYYLSNSAGLGSSGRGYGFSVRCIKD